MPSALRLGQHDIDELRPGIYSKDKVYLAIQKGKLNKVISEYNATTGRVTSIKAQDILDAYAQPKRLSYRPEDQETLRSIRQFCTYIMEKVEFQLLGRVGHGNSKNYSITLDNIPSKDPAASLARAITTFIQDLLNGINNCGLPETQEETFQRISGEIGKEEVNIDDRIEDIKTLDKSFQIKLIQNCLGELSGNTPKELNPEEIHTVLQIWPEELEDDEGDIHTIPIQHIATLLDTSNQFKIENTNALLLIFGVLHFRLREKRFETHKVETRGIKGEYLNFIGTESINEYEGKNEPDFVTWLGNSEDINEQAKAFGELNPDDRGAFFEEVFRKIYEWDYSQTNFLVLINSFLPSDEQVKIHQLRTILKEVDTSSHIRTEIVVRVLKAINYIFAYFVPYSESKYYSITLEDIKTCIETSEQSPHYTVEKNIDRNKVNEIQPWLDEARKDFGENGVYTSHNYSQRRQELSQLYDLVKTELGDDTATTLYLFREAKLSILGLKRKILQKPSISQPEEIWKLFEYYGDEDDIGTISRVFNSITSQNAHFVVGLIDITFDLPQDATWREKLAPLESQIEEHWTTINRTSRESFSSRIKNFLQHKNLSLLKQADIRGVLRVCKAKYIDPLNTPAS